MNPIEALQASGLNPIVIDENTDFDTLLDQLPQPPRTKCESNDEFLARVMNWGCPTGALIQPFIIEALIRYSKEVAASEKEWDNGLIDHASWKATGVWLLGELEKKYGGL